jgi:hypothetical protein
MGIWEEVEDRELGSVWRRVKNGEEEKESLVGRVEV